MSKILLITNTLLNLAQMGFEYPRITFELEPIDRDFKRIIIVVPGIYNKKEMYYTWALSLDWLQFTRGADHEESYITETMMRDIISWAGNEIRTQRLKKEG